MLYYLEEIFRNNVHSAEKAGIPVNIFYNRLEQGFNLELALSEPVAEKYRVSEIEISGVKYSGFIELADAFDISYIRMARCINDMWELEDIIQYANYIDKGVVYKGKWYPDNRELAKEYNISYREFCEKKASCDLTALHEILETR